MTFEILKGTKDSIPSEQIQINQVLSIIQKNFEKYGLRPFDTPLVEYFKTLSNKYEKEDEIVQEIFKVQDRGKRELGLRYDLTVPLCRYVASQKQLKLPFKRYQIGKVFRDGPIKSGRVREFLQCDADIIGIEGQAIESELLNLFYSTYKKLGINAIIEINNNKILRGVFLQSGFKKKELQSLILIFDKLKKIGEKKVLEEIKSKKLDVKKAKNAIDLLGLKIEELEKKANNDELENGIVELSILIYFLETQKINYKINFSMARGLAIYTGNIWEAYDKDKKVKSSIGSGGRYDKAIGNYIGDEREFPAVGISFGIVPMLACLKQGKNEGVTDVLVVPLDKTLIETSIKIANKLRENKNVEIFYDYKLKKAFSYAQYLGINKIAILGQKDFEQKEYTFKDLKTGKEEKVKF